MRGEKKIDVNGAKINLETIKTRIDHPLDCIGIFHLICHFLLPFSLLLLLSA